MAASSRVTTSAQGSPHPVQFGRSHGGLGRALAARLGRDGLDYAHHPFDYAHHLFNPLLELLEALLVIRVQFASGATKIRQAVREADGEEQGDDELRHGCTRSVLKG